MAAIWHQEQKLVQCSTCKQRFGQFGFFSARQRPKNGLTRFERHFLAKCPGVNGLNGELSSLLGKNDYKKKTQKHSSGGLTQSILKLRTTLFGRLREGGCANA